MKLRLCAFLLMFVLAVAAHGAALPVSKMQNAVSGVTQSKMQSRGFGSNDPRYNGTLAGMGASIAAVATQAATVTALGVTAPAWVTVAAASAAAIAVGGAVYFAIDAGLKWIFKDGNNVQIGDNVESVNTPAGLAVPTVLYCFQTTCAGSASVACRGQPKLSDAEVNGRNFSRSYVWTDTGCKTHYAQIGGDIAYDLSADTARAVINNVTVCPGTGLSASSGACPASNFPEPAPAPVKTISDAANALTAPQKTAALDPQVVADLANDFWRSAASAPGYDGLPYDATQPVTASDAAAWQSSNSQYWPSVGDFVAPQASPSGGTASAPFGIPTSITPAPSTDPSNQPSPGTNPSTEPLQNLGPDPGIGAPSLESIPTAQQIIAPLTNAFPSVKSFVVPSIDAQCPTWSVPVFGKEIAFRDHCTLLDETRPTLFAVMAVVYALMALFIVLRA